MQEQQAVKLFSPLSVREMTLKNRIVISPMCQYSAVDGLANTHHLVHLGQFALGGSGLVFFEATAVEAAGRITHGDLGLWSNEHAQAIRPVVEFIQAHGARAGIQLAHAGRKASMQRPWHGNGPLDDSDFARGECNWPIVAPSPQPMLAGWLTPEALTVSQIHVIQQSFADAAQRALDIGFDTIELHFAHGYLGHTFLSPLSNRREDAYGGDRSGRMRFALETLERTRKVWPADKPLFVRISTVDGEGGGWSIEDSLELAREMIERGADVIDCSSGGLRGAATRGDQPVPLGFRAPYSEAVRSALATVTMTHGLIIDPQQAESMLVEQRTDLIGIGRTALFDPYWPRHAASVLGVDAEYADWPEQYGWWLQRREPLLQAHGVKQLTGGIKTLDRPS